MIYDIDAAKTQIEAPVFPGSSGTLWGTHLSHWGTGGYMELPTLQAMYEIPTEGFVQENTFSSGRRKVGMIVYVIELHKWFQHRPRNKNTNQYLSLSEYEALSDNEKLVVLNPMATYTVSEFVGEDIIDTTYYGSGDPADCWTELCLDCEGGGLEFLDVYTDATLTSLSANKIIHFHTTSNTNLSVFLDFTNSDSSLQCSPGFNTAVMNVGAGMLTLNNVKGVSTVLDAQNSGAFIYVKSTGDAYAVGRL